MLLRFDLRGGQTVSNRLPIITKHRTSHFLVEIHSDFKRVTPVAQPTRCFREISLRGSGIFWQLRGLDTCKGAGGAQRSRNRRLHRSNVRGQKRFQKILHLSFGFELKLYNSLGRGCVESTGALRSFSGPIALSGPKPQCSPGRGRNKNDEVAVGTGVFARLNRPG